MGGVSVDSGGRGGRRTLDSEINMIPMIDLLMVTISFLLITAVWSHMSRINADAQVPGPPTATPPSEGLPTQLHVQMLNDGRFALVWRRGGEVVKSSEVPANEVVTTEGTVRVTRYPELAKRVTAEWEASGIHRDASDKKFDQAVLHADNGAPYSSIVGLMDALSQPKRQFQAGSKTLEGVPAFNVTFAVN